LKENKNLRYIENTKTQKRRFLLDLVIRALSFFRPYFFDFGSCQEGLLEIAIHDSKILADNSRSKQAILKDELASKVAKNIAASLKILRFLDFI